MNVSDWLVLLLGGYAWLPNVGPTEMVISSEDIKQVIVISNYISMSDR